MPELICKILHIGKTTFYRYKKEKTLAYKLISYFSKEDLNELIDSGKISKMELIKDISVDELKSIMDNTYNLETKAEIDIKLLEIEELKKQLK